MRTIATIFLILGQAAPSAPAELRPVVVVSAATAEFSVPVVPPLDGVWVWNQTGTADNQLEYCWDIRVATLAGEYTFGYYKFKYAGAPEARGTLQDLLGVGQASVWKPKAGSRGGLVVKGIQPSVSAVNGVMLVQLRDPDLVRLLFADRPAIVSVHAKAPDADAAYKVPVSYRE